jgi:hypothetical protein
MIQIIVSVASIKESFSTYHYRHAKLTAQIQCFGETSTSIFRVGLTTRPHIPADSDLNILHCDNNLRKWNRANQLRYFIFTLSVDLGIYLPMYLSIYLAPTWSIGHPCNISFQFSFLSSQWHSLDGRSAHRKTATYTEQYKHRINAHKHPCLEKDSNPRSQSSSERNSSCLRLRGHSDRRPGRTGVLIWEICSNHHINT